MKDLSTVKLIINKLINHWAKLENERESKRNLEFLRIKTQERGLDQKKRSIRLQLQILLR